MWRNSSAQTKLFHHVQTILKISTNSSLVSSDLLCTQILEHRQSQTVSCETCRCPFSTEVTSSFSRCFIGTSFRASRSPMNRAQRTDTLFMRIKRIDFSICVFKLSMLWIKIVSPVNVLMKICTPPLLVCVLSFWNVVTFLDVSRFCSTIDNTML